MINRKATAGPMSPSSTAPRPHFHGERTAARLTAVAQRLAAADGVLAVRYPGLPHDGHHAVAARQVAGPGFGGMVSFDLADRDAAEAFADACTVFLRAARGEFDAVIACYHDQAMIPVKCLSFGEAVNVTLGLPFIRTSVDHGTAFDIAGKGLAEHSSMVAAIKLAADLSTQAGESCRAVEV